jgi:hypothetical protein
MSFKELVARLIISLGEKPVPSAEGGEFFVKANLEVFECAHRDRVSFWCPEMGLGREDWACCQQAWEAFKIAADAA